MCLYSDQENDEAIKPNMINRMPRAHARARLASAHGACRHYVAPSVVRAGKRPRACDRRVARCFSLVLLRRTKA